MRNKNYAEKPLQVRLHNVQEDTLNKILNDSEYRNNILKQTKKAIDSLNIGSNTSEMAARTVMKIYQS